MKKLLTFLFAVFCYSAAFAAYPDLQDVTLTSSSGITLDFYANRSNMVVYYSPREGFSRNGTFYVGQTISSRDGYVEARFSAEISFSYGNREFSGTIYYRRSDGHVSYVTLDGTTFSSSSGRSVVPRRR